MGQTIVNLSFWKRTGSRTTLDFHRARSTLETIWRDFKQTCAHTTGHCAVATRDAKSQHVSDAGADMLDREYPALRLPWRAAMPWFR